MKPTVRGQWYQGMGGRRLWHRRAVSDQPRAGVLLLHGYSEHSGRYEHVMAALQAERFSVLAPDHRGHGRSARVHGHLESVDAVIGDLARLGDQLETLVGDHPLFLLGHSMGALLALRLLHHDPRWAGAVLNGTPIEIPSHITPTTRRLARWVGRAVPWLPLQRFYDPTRASRDPEVAARIEADPLTWKGRIRAGTAWEMLQALPEVQQSLPSIRVPVLITHGGADPTVDVRISARLHARMGSLDKELHVFDGLQHEVHQEPERDAVIGRWLVWLKRQARAVDSTTR